MATEKMTIVKKGSRISVHGSFKKACEAYGWNYEGYNKRFQKEIDEHRLMKVPVGVTINCFIMLDHCTMKSTLQSVYNIDSSEHEVTFCTAKGKQYQVTVYSSERYEPENIIDGMVESGGYYWKEATEVVDVKTWTEDGDELEIKFDSWTEKELLNIIDLSE